MISYETRKQSGKKTQKAAKNWSMLLLMSSSFQRFCQEITFRGARQKQLTSCDHDDGGKPIRGGRSLSTFSHGNHVCSHGDGCGAEMFFSYLAFVILLFRIKFRGAKLPLFFFFTKRTACFFFIYFVLLLIFHTFAQRIYE